MQGGLIDVERVVDIGIEQVHALVLLQVFVAAVRQWRVLLVAVGDAAQVDVFIFQGLIVPTLESHQAAQVAIAQ
ncbi:hypothetical protein D3C85_1754770 [compost metagenome]